MNFIALTNCPMEPSCGSLAKCRNHLVNLSNGLWERMSMSLEWRDNWIYTLDFTKVGFSFKCWLNVKNLHIFLDFYHNLGNLSLVGFLFLISLHGQFSEYWLSKNIEKDLYSEGSQQHGLSLRDLHFRYFAKGMALQRIPSNWGKIHVVNCGKSQLAMQPAD